MTSSLVGSEMCIRDSPRKGEKAPPAEVEQVPRDAPPCCPAQDEEQTWPCLLYTSDAADDM
eukprot:3981561-Prorocentrum_lima.AAC.1